MKRRIQAFLQRVLGFETYLAGFAWFKILTLRWDSPEQEGDFNFFLTLLEPDDHILDIGANIGIMTVLMGKACPHGHIYSFEPIPENMATLKRMVQHFGLQHVTPYAVALGEEEGSLSMQMPVINGVRMQGLTHVVHQSIEGYEGQQAAFNVPVKVLDDPSFSWPHGVQAIKIDVENYERFVLSGARRLIATHQPLIYCELLPGENRTFCISMLEDLGYTTQVLDRREKAPKLKAFDPSQDSQHNFFFLPTKNG